MEKYLDRTEAGRVLADKLSQYANQSDVIVLALPRGGVPVAFEIAKKLNAPLDVFIVRKLGCPGQPELAMGAIARDGVRVLNEDVVRNLGISKSAIERVAQAELQELQRREKVYRGDHLFPDIKNKTVILVDDGIATGATMRAAIKALRQLKPAEIIAAVPVAALETVHTFASLADVMICPLKPEFFYAVGAWYENFPQTSDEEVIELLREAKKFSNNYKKT